MLAGIAPRQVVAPRPSLVEEKRIPGEDAVPEDEAEAVLRVAGGVDHLHPDARQIEFVSVVDAEGDAARRRLRVHDVLAPCRVAERGRPREMVGVRVGVDRVRQLQLLAVEQLEVAGDILQGRIDEDDLA